ncbi:MAG: hypothetical protein ACE5JU_07240 [Candidatus Binatia bacterium]
MDALISGLDLEDGSIRYKVILALEEMARHFPNLQVDAPVIENALISEARRYYRRFVILFTLFGDGRELPIEGAWLLRQSLLDNMEREKERSIRLLSLIYCPEDIRRACAALQTDNPARRAHAIEFLDNLLTGNVKHHVFPLFDDAPGARLFRKFLVDLGLKTFDRDTALRELLEQEDDWLKAAAVWEIRLRGLREFREKIQEFLSSDNPVLREVAKLAITRV